MRWRAYSPFAPFARAVEAVSGGRLQVRFVNDWAARLRGRWSLDGTRLRFSEFTPAGAYRVVWASEPWVRSSR